MTSLEHSLHIQISGVCYPFVHYNIPSQGEGLQSVIQDAEEDNHQGSTKHNG